MQLIFRPRESLWCLPGDLALLAGESVELGDEIKDSLTDTRRFFISGEADGRVIKGIAFADELMINV